MKKLLSILLIAALLTLSACTNAPLFPDNESNATNETGYTPVDLPDDITIDDTPVETEDDAPVVDEPVEEEPEGDYAAVIEATEGDLIELDTRATDPDGDEVTLTFGEPLDENGEWQTEVGDAGRYEVTVTASDGKAETEALILLVIRAANSAPEITGPDTITVSEGEEVDLGIFTIIDPDGDEFVTSYSGWMRSSTYETTYDDAGEHEVRVIAEDDAGNEAVKSVTIIVENVNRRPTLDIEDRRITATEGDLITIQASADDEDGDDVTIAYEEPFDDEGEWQTEEGDAGEYRITVTASDGEDQVDRTVIITVDPANRPPVIEIDAVITVEEGDTIDLSVLADIEDPEGDDVDVSYSGWMDSATYTTSYDDAGEYEVTITASDGRATSSVDVTIIVEDVNRPPVFIRPA